MIELFSKRQQAKTVQIDDVYLYDDVPVALRNQIHFIWDEALGDNSDLPSGNYSGRFGHDNVRIAYAFIWNTFRREHGLHKDYSEYEARNNIVKFFRTCSAAHALDLIELSFKVINGFTRTIDYRNKQNFNEIANGAINELNARFEEHRIGYKFEEGGLIRVDSKFSHNEIIKPALALLNESRFKGASDEFLKAHDDYRKGDYKDCIHKACQAFESVMKIICKSRGWDFDEDAPAKKLVIVLTSNGLIKSYSSDSYYALIKLLENAIPTPRNKEASHGQGEEIKYLPPYLAAYVLNLTASTILYLVEAEKTLKE